jgi:hypothetical protein
MCTSLTDEIPDAGERAGQKDIDDAQRVRLTGGSRSGQLDLRLENRLESR